MTYRTVYAIIDEDESVYQLYGTIKKAEAKLAKINEYNEYKIRGMTVL